MEYRLHLGWGTFVVGVKVSFRDGDARHFLLRCNVFLKEQSPPREEGWTRHQERCREASSIGADGVVAHKPRFGVSNHPVCAATVASRHFVTGAATPPHEEGNIPDCEIRQRSSEPQYIRSGVPVQKHVKG